MLNFFRGDREATFFGCGGLDAVTIFERVYRGLEGVDWGAIYCCACGLGWFVGKKGLVVLGERLRDFILSKGGMCSHWKAYLL